MPKPTPVRGSLAPESQSSADAVAAEAPIALSVADQLAGQPLFASLSPQAIRDVADRFVAQSFARDAILFLEGTPPDWLCVVVSGYVKCVKHSGDGRDMLLHIAQPGDLVGSVAAFGRRPHPYTAQAMQPTTVVRTAGPAFAALMAAHPAVAQQTVAELVERLTEAHEAMKSLAIERVERRIARQLEKLALRSGRRVALGVEIGVPLRRQDVADMAGTTVETAIRVLSRWQANGVVASRDGHVVVTDSAALRKLAED